MKDKESGQLKKELTKLQNELTRKNNELDQFQSTMNHEKLNLTAQQEKIICHWKEKYEKVCLMFNSIIILSNNLKIIINILNYINFVELYNIKL